MTTTTALTPAEIDTELARLWAARQTAENNARRYADFADRYPNRVAYQDDRDRWTVEATAARDEAAPFEAEFKARGGWNRYFLVSNTNGHVHRGMTCSTCFSDTQYRWLVDLADCDESAMVEEWGERACTVCFPDAPTNPAYNRPARIDREAAEQRAADKATRAADKAEKAITGPDGGPLRIPNGHYTDTIATKIAARNELSLAVQNFGWYGADEYRVRAVALIEALERHGVDTAPVIARAAAKVAKEGGEHAWQ